MACLCFRHRLSAYLRAKQFHSAFAGDYRCSFKHPASPYRACKSCKRRKGGSVNGFNYNAIYCNHCRLRHLHPSGACPALPHFQRQSRSRACTLSGVLPMAIMATLVIYCLKGISFSSAAGFAPLLIASAVTAILHLWKRSTLISIFCGTVCYMVLLQLVFA